MMNSIGIIGGYSAIGQHCVDELAKATTADLLIAGRDVRKAAEQVARYKGRVSAIELDVYDKEKLALFCQRCDVIINCSGPSTVILDRIALACLASDTHYIDIGGYDILHERLLKVDKEIKRKGLTFLISAGFIPGISGVLSIHLADLAAQEMRIKSVETFITGKEKWSYGSCRDMVWAMFEDHNGYFQNARWIPQNILLGTRRERLDPTERKRWFYPMFNNQLKNFALAKAYPKVAEYMGSEEFDALTTLKILYIKQFMRNDPEKAAKILHRSIEKAMQGADAYGLVHVNIRGSNGEKASARLYTDDNNRMTGTAPAITAQLLLEGHIPITGLHYMCEAVPAQKYLDMLARRGFSIKISKNQPLKKLYESPVSE